MLKKNNLMRNQSSILKNGLDYQINFYRCSILGQNFSFSEVFCQVVYLMKDVIVLKINDLNSYHIIHIFLGFGLQ